MRHRGVEVSRFACYLLLVLLVEFLQVSHYVNMLGYEYEHDSDVLGECEQQLSEVLGLHRHVLLVQLVGLDQSAHDDCHVLAVFFLNLVLFNYAVGQCVVGEHAQHRGFAHAYLAHGQVYGVQVLDDRVQHLVVSFARQGILSPVRLSFVDDGAEHLLGVLSVVGCELVAGLVHYLAVETQHLD